MATNRVVGSQVAVLSKGGTTNARVTNTGVAVLSKGGATNVRVTNAAVFVAAARPQASGGFDPALSIATLSNSDLTATGSGTGKEQGAKANGPAERATGKWFFEVQFSNAVAQGSNYGAGLFRPSGSPSNITFSSMGDNTSDSIIARASGNVFSAGTNRGGSRVGPTSLVQFAVDLDNRRLWVRPADGGTWNNNGSADPATNVGGYDIAVANQPMLPFVVFGNGGADGQSATINLGYSAFASAMPSGFAAWVEAPSEVSEPSSEPGSDSESETLSSEPPSESEAPSSEPLSSDAPSDVDSEVTSEDFPPTGPFFNNVDYDSIYSRGDRITNGLFSFANEIRSPEVWSAPFSQAFDANYGFAGGNGPYLPGGDIAAGAFVAVAKLASNPFGEQIGLSWRAARFRSTSAITTVGFWQFYAAVGGIPSPFPLMTYEFGWGNGADPVLGGYTFEVPFNDEAFWHIPFDSIALSNSSAFEDSPGGRMCGELEFAIAHSNLDGGDRTFGPKKIKIEASFAPSAGSLLNLIRGRHFANNSGFTGPKYDPAATLSAVTTGAWIQFHFPREVGMREMVLETSTPEVLASGLPTKHGVWQWIASNDGATWEDVGDPWHFGPGNYMVAPTPTPYSSVTLYRFWRMVLVSDTAFVGAQYWGFTFNLAETDDGVLSEFESEGSEFGSSGEEPSDDVSDYLPSYLPPESDSSDGTSDGTSESDGASESEPPSEPSSMSEASDSSGGGYPDEVPIVQCMVVTITN